MQLENTVKIQMKLKNLRILYIQRASLKTLMIDFDQCSIPQLELLDIENAHLELKG